MTSAVDRIVRPVVCGARLRVLVKTGLYRLFMIAVTFVVALFFTRNPSQALDIGIVANVAKTVIYYLYEHLWTHAVEAER